MPTADSIKVRLDRAVAPYRLLEHPFYVSWREGTLPVAALRAYAAEYGALIAAIDQGWETVGKPEHAAEERQHAALWQRFAAELGTEISIPQVPEVAEMMATAHRLFAEPESAWGALYSFESQQPDTAAEKLAGLDAHYGISAESAASEYFRVHAAVYDEAEQIVTSIEGHGGEEPAVEACGAMSRALWGALSGIQARYC
jgi:pyrroloquinoline quinone (PQQ) biosynthesis protein C